MVIIIRTKQRYLTVSLKIIYLKKQNFKILTTRFPYSFRHSSFTMYVYLFIYCVNVCVEAIALQCNSFFFYKISSKWNFYFLFIYELFVANYCIKYNPFLPPHTHIILHTSFTPHSVCVEWSAVFKITVSYIVICCDKNILEILIQFISLSQWFINKIFERLEKKSWHNNAIMSNWFIYNW